MTKLSGMISKVKKNTIEAIPNFSDEIPSENKAFRKHSESMEDEEMQEFEEDCEAECDLHRIHMLQSLQAL